MSALRQSSAGEWEQTPVKRHKPFPGTVLVGCLLCAGQLLWASLVPGGELPVINQQPQSQTVPCLASATLAVAAAGPGPLSYQWLKNDLPIPGATSDQLFLPQVWVGDAGCYSVSVANPNGAVLSTRAELSVTAPKPGGLDPSFVPALPTNTLVSALAVQPDGKVLVTGSLRINTTNAPPFLWRLNADGSLDTNFVCNTFSRPIFLYAWNSLALQADGKILLGTAGATVLYNGLLRAGVVRLLNNGAVDLSFAVVHPWPRQVVYCLAVQPDGKVLFGGEFSALNVVPRTNLARLNFDGTLDRGFLNGLPGIGGTNGYVQCLALQPDGKVLIGGGFTNVNGVGRDNLARLNSDGTLDTGFLHGLSGGYSWVSALALQPDQKVVVGGYFRGGNGVTSRVVTRLNPDGNLDPGFLNTNLSLSVYSVVIQADGRVLVAGNSDWFYGEKYSFARLLPNGALDTGFLNGMAGISGGVRPPGGVDMEWDGTAIWAMALQGADRVLIGGNFTRFNGQPVPSLARVFIGSLEPPAIAAQPTNQAVVLGADATFAVLATGESPFRYQWFKNSVLLPGATNSTLALPAARKTDEGLYSVEVSNPFGTITSSQGLLRVDLPPIADASATQPVFISPNGSNALVILDGTRSSDPDGELLSYCWFEAGTELARGAVALVTLPVGTHWLRLVVSDGVVSATNGFTVQVITTIQALQNLAVLIEASVPRARPLLASLESAIASLQKGQVTAALNQLGAFQNEVRAQVGRDDPALTARLIQAAQAVIDVLAGRHAHLPGRLVSMSPLPNGRVRIVFDVEPGPAYVLQASTNLRDWDNIGIANGPASGRLQLEDASAARFPNRFYRLVSP